MGTRHELPEESLAGDAADTVSERRTPAGSSGHISEAPFLLRKTTPSLAVQ